MDIEIPKQDRMTETGSSLLRLIQNTNTPILDLFVRESIQNSLDAHKNNVKSVNVEYISGKFDSHGFNSELTGITKLLDKKYPENEYDFLAIKDSNTVGLTGPVTEDDVENDDFGNLLKLVYHISKPQTNNGAGGSWGLGKTIYFRIGIGLVVYYSRIKTSKGTEDRLVATLVENEKNPDSYLKTFTKKSKRGIAWWGKQQGKTEKTIPVTNSKQIHKLLSYFNIDLFDENETGTVVIIPYINKEKLCKVNQFNEIEGNTKYSMPSWCNNLSEYLKVAAERWYCCRLNNKEYPYGPYLKLKISDSSGSTVIARSKMEPIFNLINEYSKYGYSGLWNQENDFDFDEPQKIDVSFFKYFKHGNDIAGTLIFSKIKKEKVKFSYSPLMYLNEKPYEEEGNPPIVAYIRQPGMIVSYDYIGHWVKGIPDTNDDEIIVGLFILNSKNELRSSTNTYTLEDYVRLSELADHFSWKDHLNCGDIDFPIIEKIQNKVRTYIKNQYSEIKGESEIVKNDAISRQLGEILLPQRGYGTAAISRGRSIQTGIEGNSSHHKTSKAKVLVLTEKIEYKEKFIVIPISIKLPRENETKEIDFDLNINTENKIISLDEWENQMNLKKPFEIRSVYTELIEKDQVIFQSSEIQDPDISCNFQSGNFIIKKTKTGTKYITSVFIEKLEDREVVLYLNIEILNRDYQPVIKW